MNRFRDPEAAQGALERIARLASLPAEGLIEGAFEGCPHPDQALTHLERWLRASANPATQLQHLLAAGPLARLFVGLLGASHQLADVLIQNPELGDRVLDPSALTRRPTVESVREECQRLLASAHSYTHQLDRLRFVKQSWSLAIAANDLARSWPEDEVWSALSDVAEALLDELAGVVWAHYRSQREAPEACPVMIVGMGKLGGRELNYSSDVDLVYVLRDDADEVVERHAQRFCELFGRAASDRMGRGALFRVDLRLRPFGASGQILTRLKAVRGYYERYAEPWERLALIRSRAVGGDRTMAEAWEALRLAFAFPERQGEWALDETLRLRERTEDLGGASDLKRGAGGIRDVEFLVQILQSLNGAAVPEATVPGTLPALRVLAVAGLLPPDEAAALAEGYTLLRQAEHRIQLVGDRQTHALPAAPEQRLYLARSMGLASGEALVTRLDSTRQTIRQIYDRRLRPQTGAGGRQEVAGWLGAHSALGLRWLDAIEGSAGFYATLVENEGSLARFEQVVREAPALVDALQADVALTEQLFSGEIEEPEGRSGRIMAIGRARDAEDLGRLARRAWAAAACAFVLADEEDLGAWLADIADAVLLTLVRLAEGPLEVVALGSFAARDLAPGSDLDALLVTPPEISQAQGEMAAQRVLAMVNVARRKGAPIELDLRLRPEGRAGLLAPSRDSLAAYEAGAMEPWERFALGRARSVGAGRGAEQFALRAAYGRPLDGATLDGLLHMKHRIETERVPPHHLARQVKLGHGGLDDIDWLAQLTLMRYPAAAEGVSARTEDRLHALLGAQLLNAAEVDELRGAHRFLRRLRARLWLLNIEGDRIPDNPDKLERIANAMGQDAGNDLLAAHRDVAHGVRTIYEDAVLRLKRSVGR